MTTKVMDKAHRLYTEGHVHIVRQTEDGTLIAFVKSGSDPKLTYRVEVNPGGWSCACKHGQQHTDCDHVCSHVEAVAMKVRTER
ncbi:hypothetical protein LCGC14_0397000 [marine sediment metagenome]|uniref:SWIM-type domain-containing protein n=1 Tax=marine sediment metagenome TaxID=412755 RepID=A0A0F9TFW7_9ZZZZ